MNNKLSQKLNSIMDKYRVIGLQAAAIFEGNVIWSGSYGFRSLETMDQVTEKTMFRIASITKLFTATAVMKLVENGILNIDEDISYYLKFQIRNPNFPNEPITLRQLMTHTASLTNDEESDGIYALYIKEGYSSNSPTLKDLLIEGGRFYKKEIWGNWKPGEPNHWNYSNIGSIICSAIVETVSGLRFDQYLHKNIFRPLGIVNASCSMFGIKEEHELANLYEYDQVNNQFKLTIEDTNLHPLTKSLNHTFPGQHGGLFEPQGGLRISALELSKFLIAHMYDGENLLHSKTSKMMKSIHWSRDSKDHFFTKMGLQFHISHNFLENYDAMIGHAGEAYGLISNLYFEDEKKFGIVFITNGSVFGHESNNRFDVEKEIANSIYSHILKDLIE